MSTSYDEQILAAAGPQYHLLTGDEFEALPGTEWLVKGLLPTQGIAAIYGASGSGKTFLCLDLGLAIAGDGSWFGHRIPKNRPVVYCPLEAEGGIRKRIQAWRLHREASSSPRLFWVMKGSKVTLGEPGDMDALGKTILERVGTGAVTIIDTLYRAMSGDENNGADMRAAVDGAHELQRITGGLVILVHHTGKDAAKGLRGHSGLPAALDASLFVSTDKGVRQFSLAKAKDGEAGLSFGFKLRHVPLGNDADGDEVTSCAIEWDKVAVSVLSPVREPVGINQRVAFSVIKGALAGGKAVTKDGRLVLTYSVARDAVAQNLVAEGRIDLCRARERAGAAISGLIKNGFIQQCGSALKSADSFVWAG